MLIYSLSSLPYSQFRNTKLVSEKLGKCNFCFSLSGLWLSEPKFLPKRWVKISKQSYWHKDEEVFSGTIYICNLNVRILDKTYKKKKFFKPVAVFLTYCFFMQSEGDEIYCFVFYAVWGRQNWLFYLYAVPMRKIKL